MRVLPSLTYSAITPSSRRFTSSMKAGGNDHSRPTNKPTFSVIALLPRSVVTIDVVVYHLLPPGPVVRPAVQDTHGMPDNLPPQDIRHLLITTARWIIPANGQNNVHVP